MKKIIFLLAGILLCTSCSIFDDNEFEPFLPEATMTGANTFGAYANGILITPRDGEGTFGNKDKGLVSYIGADPLDTIIRYRALQVYDYKSEKRSNLRINMKGLVSFGEGEYEMDDSECATHSATINDNVFCKIYNYETGTYNVYCSIKDSGYITITRYGDGYLAGTFYCAAVNKEDPEDIIQITDGRFDVYSPTLKNTVFP